MTCGSRTAPSRSSKYISVFQFFMYKMHTHFAVVRVELIPIWVLESYRNIPQPGQFSVTA